MAASATKIVLAIVSVRSRRSMWAPTIQMLTIDAMPKNSRTRSTEPPIPSPARKAAM
ncbi:hypothetical protein [Saccharopolyspora spinosa]|uniref:hypothetical protein n=1 Tax=Saccharopolyspora spinosa TaxID=60894 RepID=UPI000237AB3F